MISPGDLLERDVNELGCRCAACLLGEELDTWEVIGMRVYIARQRASGLLK